jgi:hypothetical protein
MAILSKAYLLFFMKKIASKAPFTLPLTLFKSKEIKKKIKKEKNKKEKIRKKKEIKQAIKKTIKNGFDVKNKVYKGVALIKYIPVEKNIKLQKYIRKFQNAFLNLKK